MVLVPLGLGVVPDGGLLAVGIPGMLSVLEEAVQNRLMLPLVVRASQHQGILHPDTTSSEVEPGVDKSPAEVQPLGVGVEHIGSAAFFQHRSHRLESGEQECVEFLVLHAVVLDGQPGGAFEGHPVRRVGHDQVGAFTAHKFLHIFSFGGVPTHQAVSADCPDIARFHKGRFLQGGGQVEIIILRLVTVPGVQRLQFLLIEACQHGVELHLAQGFNFDAQHLLIPPGVQRHAVVRQDVCFLLRLGQVVGVDAGNLGDAFLLCRHDAAVTGDHVVIPVDDDGIHKAEFPQRSPELLNLLRAVCPRVIDVRYQFRNRYPFHFRRHVHRTNPHSANASKPPRERMYSRASSTISL